MIKLKSRVLNFVPNGQTHENPNDTSISDADTQSGDQHEPNDNAIGVMTRGGKMTQEPLYPEGHPKRVEQDS